MKFFKKYDAEGAAREILDRLLTLAGDHKILELAIMRAVSRNPNANVEDVISTIFELKAIIDNSSNSSAKIRLLKCTADSGSCDPTCPVCCNTKCRRVIWRHEDMFLIEMQLEPLPKHNVSFGDNVRRLF